MKAPNTRLTRMLAGTAVGLSLAGLTINSVYPLPLAGNILAASAGMLGLLFLLPGREAGTAARTNGTKDSSRPEGQPASPHLSLLSTLEYGYILCDSQLNILEFNAVIGDMLGIHKADFLAGCSLHEAFFRLAKTEALRLSEEDLEELDQRLKVFHGGGNMEFDVRTRHDSWLHIQLYHRPEPGDQNETVLVVVRDISQLKIHENDLRHSKSRMKDLAEVASDWFWEMDEELRFSYFSPRIKEFIGYDPSNILGKRRDELFYPGQLKQPEIQQHLKDLEQHRPFKDFRYTAALPDGTFREIMVSGLPVFDDQGAFTGYRGAGRDITAKVAAQEAALEANHQLKDQSHLFQTILDGLAQGIITFSKDLTMQTCNKRVIELFELDEKLRRPGTPMADIIRHNLEQGWLTNFDGDIEAQIEQRLEVLRIGGPGSDQFSHPDGRILEVYRNRLPDGTFILTYTDISSQLHHELELRKAKEEAEFANHAKSQFLANMSHELRTPLNAIIGFSEIIRDELYGTISHPEYKDFARDIHQSGTHLLEIISDLLDLSKIEAGQKDLNESEMCLREAAESCIHYVKQKAALNEVSIQIDKGEELPLLYADELIVRQVIINLMTNAVTFTRQGTITISAMMREDGGQRLSIADTGIGMDEHEISIALTPFAQVESHLTRHHEGTGLGLPLVVNLIKLHGGLIHVESEKNKGTTVHVDFPAERTLGKEPMAGGAHQ
ncbi:PAS domain-containing sensor histidine kinase [Aestuariispira insulae]|uniref:histidine kinase n=1 Tax=Aestuariispira insulae TaxID=1461337 RepID=A0A3D9HS62_9PROT|nr:PAS domain-containing sensor histidine kinase [Aestuariispira insulae]RED52353.1 PAS domain S-box-containing protein [Aestuariispira insulae]